MNPVDINAPLDPQPGVQTPHSSEPRVADIHAPLDPQPGVQAHFPDPNAEPAPVDPPPEPEPEPEPTTNQPTRTPESPARAS